MSSNFSSSLSDQGWTADGSYYSMVRARAVMHIANNIKKTTVKFIQLITIDKVQNCTDTAR